MSFAPLPFEVTNEFYARTTPPRQDQLDALAAQHISVWSLAGLPGSGESTVGFCRTIRDGSRFEFGDDGLPAMAVVARDQYGDAVDIVAWSNRPAWIGSWLGRAALLGAQYVFGPRLDEAATIFPDAMAWLRGERHGAVLVDGQRAARELVDAGPFLAAGGIEHAERLAVILTPPKPVILVPVQEERRAA